MQQSKSRKWITVAVLGITSLSFLGLSMVPLVTGILNQKSAPKPSQSPAIANNPSDPKQLQETEKNYLTILEREPNNANALQGIVETRLQLIQAGQRKAEDIIDPLEKLTKLQPERTEYQLVLAQAQQKAGKLDKATQAYQQILTKSPTNGAALQGMTQLLMQQQRAAEAIPMLEQGLAAAQEVNKKQPGSVDTIALNLLLGDVYRAQKDTVAATKIYERLMKEFPNDFRPVATKGFLLKDQGKKEEALKQFQAALALASAEDKPRVQALIDALQAPATVAPSPSPSK